jgi:hypothetical protein
VPLVSSSLASLRPNGCLAALYCSLLLRWYSLFSILFPSLPFFSLIFHFRLLNSCQRKKP